MVRIEEATDPKRRARLRALSRRPTASRRLRAHLNQIAELQKYRLPADSPTGDDPPTVKAVDSHDASAVPASAH